MNKLWKNFWFVAFLLLIISFAVGLLLIGLISLGLPQEITGLSGLLAALLLGMLYVNQTKKVMAPVMRRNVAVIYGVVQIVMTGVILNIYGSALELSALKDAQATLLGTAALLLTAYCFIIYWLLKFGGEQYKKRK